MEHVRVFVAVEGQAIRKRLHELLRAAPDIEVVGEATSGEEALLDIGSVSPDVVLVDARLPGVDGLRVTRFVHQHNPTTSVIVLAEEESDEELFNAIRYGASAYLPGDTSRTELHSVIQQVRTGTYVIDDYVLSKPALALRVLSAFRELAVVDKQVAPLLAPLSAREIEVLEHAAHGNSNKAIARAMSISDQTVKNHLTSIMRKLAVNDRTQAVVYALQHGWIRVEDM